jgi:ribose-phosphate pyrophosphokinase
MTGALIVALPGSDHLAAGLARQSGAEIAEIEFRHFPDGEVYLRYCSDPRGRPVVILSPLDRPDAKILPVLFAADAARDLGAARVGLVAPYLAYMRQDRRFHPGEAVTSATFAQVISSAVDWLVTIDPHLHRHGALSDIYAIPATALHAAPLIAEWIAREVASPVLIGPDAESKQWVGEVAALAGAPYVVLEKQRRGDRQVDVSVPHVAHWKGSTPVLVDDIISSGETMLATIARLAEAGLRPAACIGVHGVFAGDAHGALLRAGAARVVTTNTIAHASNAIDVTGLLAAGIGELIATTGQGT